MCGRYTQAQSVKELAARFALKTFPTSLAPRYNIAPGQDAAVVILERGKRTLAELRWGLVPSWAADASVGAKLINARAESVKDKPSFKSSFRSARCLIPADSFYEWDKDKNPFRICPQDLGLFAFAGLWDRWEAPDGKELRTFTIITTDASPAVKPVHGRMPVILRPEKEGYWLDPKADADSLAELLAPYPQLKSHPVSKLVNSPSNEGPECGKPIALAQPEFWG